MDMTFVTNLLLASVRMATPLIFVSLAELYSQRAGLTNIGLEGLATIGSLVGFMVSLLTDSPMLGVLAGMMAGIIVNMIFAYATISLCAEQIVYGMAINIFAPALAPRQRSHSSSIAASTSRSGFHWLRQPTYAA